MAVLIVSRFLWLRRFSLRCLNVSRFNAYGVSMAAPFLVSLPNARLKVSGFQVSMVGVISIVETLRATSEAFLMWIEYIMHCELM